MRFAVLLLTFGSAHADVNVTPQQKMPTDWRLRWPEKLPCESFETIKVTGANGEVDWSGSDAEVVLRKSDSVSNPMIRRTLREPFASRFETLTYVVLPGFLDRFDHVHSDVSISLTLGCASSKESLHWNLEQEPEVWPTLSFTGPKPVLPSAAQVATSGITRDAARTFLKSAQNFIETICEGRGCDPDLLRAAQSAGQLSTGELQSVKPSVDEIPYGLRSYTKRRGMKAIFEKGRARLVLICGLSKRGRSRRASCDALLFGEEDTLQIYWDDEENRWSDWHLGAFRKSMSVTEGDEGAHIGLAALAIRP
jgi:hypothetical protein